MQFWIFLWKFVFIVTVVLFTGMTVWVTIGGWIDIRDLFRHLGSRDDETLDQDQEEK